MLARDYSRVLVMFLFLLLARVLRTIYLSSVLIWWLGGLTISSLTSGLSGEGHCVMFLGKTIFSHLLTEALIDQVYK